MRILIALVILVFAPLANAQLSVKKNEWVETPLASVPNGEIVMAVHQNYPGSCSHTVFSVYWDIPVTREITAEDDARLLKEKIFPAMKDKCPRMPIYDLSHFIKGKPLYNEHGDEVAFAGRQNVFYEDRFILGTASVRAYPGALTSFASTEQEIARNAKTADVSRKANEQMRASAISDEVQQREAKCEAETLGGQHPCGLRLARAYVQYVNKVASHCTKLIEHEWCNVDGGRTYVRWLGATKHSCVSREGEKDTMVCKFTVEWDCRVRDQRTNEAVEDPTVKAMLCAGFPNMELRSQVKKAGAGWETKLLRPKDP